MAVIIGMDPHKRSATIEVVDERAQILAVGRYGTDQVGYGEMLVAGRVHSDRTWAVEGCNGIGRHIAHRLVHDGETVVDVPAKLSAQVRVFATGNGRKTDQPLDMRAKWATMAGLAPKSTAGRVGRRHNREEINGACTTKGCLGGRDLGDFVIRLGRYRERRGAYRHDRVARSCDRRRDHGPPG